MDTPNTMARSPP